MRDRNPESACAHHSRYAVYDTLVPCSTRATWAVQRCIPGIHSELRLAQALVFPYCPRDPARPLLRRSEAVQRYGKALINLRPEEATRLIMDLCTQPQGQHVGAGAGQVDAGGWLG